MSEKTDLGEEQGSWGTGQARALADLGIRPTMVLLEKVEQTTNEENLEIVLNLLSGFQADPILSHFLHHNWRFH